MCDRQLSPSCCLQDCWSSRHCKPSGNLSKIHHMWWMNAWMKERKGKISAAGMAFMILFAVSLPKSVVYMFYIRFALALRLCFKNKAFRCVHTGKASRATQSYLSETRWYLLGIEVPPWSRTTVNPYPPPPFPSRLFSLCIPTRAT